MQPSGLYGLVSLDGRPVDPDDAATLGLGTAISKGPWPPALFGGADSDAPQRVSRAESAHGTIVFVGDLADPEVQAASLGLARRAPSADIAAAALVRHGSDTPAHLLGEWSLLHWHPARGVTLMQSAGRADRIFYAVVGQRVAIAPHIFTLARLPWVGSDIDEAGILFPIGRADVRRGWGDRTMFARVREVEPATRVTIAPDGGVSVSSADAFTPQPRFTGTLADAVAETEALLRRIMAERLARHRHIAPMCSGGLDSSLLSWLAAATAGADNRLTLLTSVAPLGSGLADEADYAAMVAERLGLPQVTLYPPHDADIYRPPDHILGGGNGPIQSNRHVLTERLHRAAREAGATLMLDGTYGEMSVTLRLPAVDQPSAARRLRRLAGRIVRTLHGLAQPPLNPFHVRLAPHRMAALPADIRAALALPPWPEWRPFDKALLGFVPGIEKGLRHPNVFYPGAVRADYPYRDLRLLRLFAGMPVALLAAADDRAVGRHMLSGRLPDAVRLRRRGMPASPDHLLRIQRQAEAARTRIAVFRRAGVDDWIDLDWLDAGLARVAARGARDHDEANQVQVTAIAAEFFLWWFERSGV